jgi:transcriptional regulator with XRE-family HTH domain
MANGKSFTRIGGAYLSKVPRRRIEEPDEVERAVERSFDAERRALAEGVRQRRQARGWTQQRLAEESRLSVIYISHLELARPNVNPTLRALASLAHALDCRVGDLAAPTPDYAGAVAAGVAPVGRTLPRKLLLVAEPPPVYPASRGSTKPVRATAKPVRAAALHGLPTPRKSRAKRR